MINSVTTEEMMLNNIDNARQEKTMLDNVR